MRHNLKKDIAPEVGLTLKDICNINLNDLGIHAVKRIDNQVHITIVVSDEEIQHHNNLASKAADAKYIAQEGWEGNLFRITGAEVKSKQEYN